MSVATEIQRLQAAKADIKTAIEAKGVTVPSTTKLDGYASLIAKIGTVPYDAEIEYLESTGTQYITTDIIPSSVYDVELKMQSDSGNSFRTIIGSVDTNYFIPVGVNGSNLLYTQVGSSPSYANTNISATSLKTIHAYIRKDSIHIDVDSYGFQNTYSGPVSNLPFFIFARNTSNGAANIISAKLYFLKVRLDNVLVLDLIPVRVGQVGYLYDKIHKQLYGNSGAGAFTLGPDVISDSEALQIITQGE